MVPPGQAGPLLVAVGAVSVVTTCGAEVAEQPLALVTVTVYKPAVETTIDCVVAPVDQRFPVVDEEVRVIELPGQKLLGPLMIGVAGAGFTVTLNGMVVAEQPLALVTVSVYPPAAETLIDCVVAPVDQRFPVAEDDVSVVELPAQNVLTPLMTGVGGSGFTVTAYGAEAAEQPFASVTFTV